MILSQLWLYRRCSAAIFRHTWKTVPIARWTYSGIIPILHRAVIHRDKEVILFKYIHIVGTRILPPAQIVNPYFSVRLHDSPVSNACTLICLLVAVRISREHLLIYDVEKCPKLNIIVAEAIIEGNETHAWLIKNGLISDPYLNTEEALKYGGKSLDILKEWVQQLYTWSKLYLVFSVIDR